MSGGRQNASRESRFVVDRLYVGRGGPKRFRISTSRLQTSLDRAIAANASGGTSIWYLSHGVFQSGNLVINNSTDLHLTGPGKIQWVGEVGSGNIGFQLSGTNTRFSALSVKVQGDGVLAHNHAGFWSFTGHTLIDPQIRWCEITDVVLGISLGGFIDGGLIERNTVTNVIGSTPGHYGIHVANERLTAHRPMEILYNTVERTHRHAYYLAAGSGFIFHGNVSIDHRIGDTSDEHLYPAVSIARVTNVDMDGTWIENCYDVCLGFDPDVRLPLSTITCKNVKILNPKPNATVMMIYVGATNPDTPNMGATRGITLSGVGVYIGDSGVNRAFLDYYSGKDVVLDNVRIFYARGVTATVDLLVLRCLGESAGTATFSRQHHVPELASSWKQRPERRCTGGLLVCLTAGVRNQGRVR